MPTPRRSRAAVSATSTPLRLGSAADDDGVSTPPPHHHHQTADELAIQEAADIVHEVEEEVETPVALLSPRARRYAELTRKRDMSMEPTRSPSVSLLSPPPTAVARARSPLAAEAPNDVSHASDKEDPGDSASDEESDSDASDSDSDSTSESDSDADSDDSSDDESDDEAELERQLAAAKLAAKRSAPKPKSAVNNTALGEDDDGELRLEPDEPKETPIPDLAVPKLPARHLSLAADGSVVAGEAEAGPSKPRAQPELDRGRYERTLSKREKRAQPKKASASELWATIPAAREDDMPQMKRDYQALQLSQTLDPKRFMKGGSKSNKVPERFQIGTMVEAPRHLQDTTIRKERKYRPGSIVNEIVADTTVGTYAKRKFEDLQSKRIFNGRGKGWQKRAKW